MAEIHLKIATASHKKPKKPDKHLKNREKTEIQSTGKDSFHQAFWIYQMEKKMPGIQSFLAQKKQRIRIFAKAASRQGIKIDFQPTGLGHADLFHLRWADARKAKVFPEAGPR